MGATPYQPVSWGDEPLDKDKLNAMGNNEQWLFENMPRAYVNSHGIKRTSGLKLLAGTVSIGSSSLEHVGTTVYFGSYFSAGCRPVIIASPNVFPQGRVHVVIRGIGILAPDNRGFEVRVYSNEINSKANNIRNAMYVNYIAVGW